VTGAIAQDGCARSEFSLNLGLGCS